MPATCSGGSMNTPISSWSSVPSIAIPCTPKPTTVRRISPERARPRSPYSVCAIPAAIPGSSHTPYEQNEPIPARPIVRLLAAASASRRRRSALVPSRGQQVEYRFADWTRDDGRHGNDPCPPVACGTPLRPCSGPEARMGLFDRSASKLSASTRLLLTADPGDALLDAARLYDPEVRRWPGRLIFRNGVLLFGPVAVTPKLEQQAGLPAGIAVAWYTRAALQPHREERSHAAKHDDGDKLVRGLADRLGGTVQYAGPPPNLALLTSVYSEQALAPDRVIEVLRPYGGNFRVEDEEDQSYC